MTFSYIARYSFFLTLTNTTEGFSSSLGNVENGTVCICICLMQDEESRINSTSYLIFHKTIFLRPRDYIRLFIYTCMPEKHYLSQIFLNDHISGGNDKI